MSEPSVRCFRKEVKLSGTARLEVMLLQMLQVKFIENRFTMGASGRSILNCPLPLT